MRRRAAGFLGPSGVGPGRVSGGSEGGRSGCLSLLRAEVLSGASVSNPASFMPEPPRWRPWESGGCGGSRLSRPVSGHPPPSLCVKPDFQPHPCPSCGGLGVSPLPQPRAPVYPGHMGTGTLAAGPSVLGVTARPPLQGAAVSASWKGLAFSAQVGPVAARGRRGGFLAGTGLRAVGGAAPCPPSGLLLSLAPWAAAPSREGGSL